MIYYQDKDMTLYQGKMQDVLDTLESNSIDSIVTDPPYCLADLRKRWSKATSLGVSEGTQFGRLDKGFMGKEWDNDVAMLKETWEKCYRVLKSGGYLLAFGGTRTFHRIACAIEDAGFEIRDTIMWLYGSGFPKSMNIGLAIDKKLGCSDRGHRIAVANRCHPDGTIEPNGENLESYKARTELGKEWESWGTALKPAYEPIIVARKPVEKSIAENVMKYRTGGINIDECRIAFESTPNPATNPLYRKNGGYKLPEKGQVSKGSVSFSSSKNDANENGRFPANIIHDGSEEVISRMSDTKSEGGCSMKNSMFNLEQQINDYNFHDEGNASRYFYCAKASKKDRDDGLDELEDGNITDGRKAESDRPYLRKESIRNIHPTVKPIELMQYLVRLVTPKSGTILDCFMGSGSTGKAVMFENRERNANYKFIGIEMTEEYLPIAKSRIIYGRDKYEYDYKKYLEEEKEKTGQLSIEDFL